MWSIQTKPKSKSQGERIMREMILNKSIGGEGTQNWTWTWTWTGTVAAAVVTVVF